MFGLPGGPDWIVIFIVALLVFGRRLPEVAGKLARQLVQFRKGLADMQQDLNKELNLHETKRELDSMHDQVTKNATNPEPREPRRLS